MRIFVYVSLFFVAAYALAFYFARPECRADLNIFDCDDSDTKYQKSLD